MTSLPLALLLFATCAELPAQSAPATRAAAAARRLDYPGHVAALRKKLTRGPFHIVVQKPFVVLGDEAPRMVERRAVRTVKWAVDLLKKDFFAKDPDHIIDIWLFKNAKSYRKHCRELFAEEPGTPFGFYLPRKRALIMDISTGGGTLVHEIVHPFMRANFPACPAWFNEGLGSLFEQCRERNRRIVGSTNWRLAGLQDAIRKGQVPPLEQLTKTSEREFYGIDRGTNYAQARYLCYYLQETGRLRKFYRSFVAAHRKDPSGYATLAKLLGTDDMAAFQSVWEKFVLGLRFR
ncbi:MAG: hypothetical protein ACE5F1_20660 [Planctomycetota bacterium]